METLLYGHKFIGHNNSHLMASEHQSNSYSIKSVPRASPSELLIRAISALFGG